MKIEDTEGNEYYQVDNLSQDIVYKGIVNKDTSTNNFVPNLLKPFLVPRRFTLERDSAGQVFIQFGGGSDSDDVNDTISDPSEVTLQMHGKDYISSTYFDPNAIAYNTKLGIGPSNTSLNITYRISDDGSSNASVGSVNTVLDMSVEFNDESTLDTTVTDLLRNTVEVDNSDAIVGDISFPTTDEIRQRVLSTFATQNRAVTREDYIYLAYAMPNNFGSIKRAKF